MWLRSKAPNTQGKVVSIGAITFSGESHTEAILYVFEREEFLRLKKDFAAFKKSGVPESGTYEGRELRSYPGGRSDASSEMRLTITFKEIYSIDE
jgi:hypothetical protein